MCKYGLYICVKILFKGKLLNRRSNRFVVMQVDCLDATLVLGHVSNNGHDRLLFLVVNDIHVDDATFMIRLDQVIHLKLI